MTADDDLIVGFRAYLGEFGITSESIAIYVHHARRALAAGGWIARLRSKLAPKTLRVIRASARHWADWQRDEDLRAQLKRFRLPAPRRVQPKEPLTRAQLRRVMKAIDLAKHLPPAEQATLGLMAARGFRVGDVLRMRRVEIERAAKAPLAFEAKGKRRVQFQVLRTFQRWLAVLAAQPGSWQRVEDLVAARSKDSARRATGARRIQRELARIGSDLGIEGLHPHRFRRTYAVLFLQAHQGDPEAVAKLTEHMQWGSPMTAFQYIDHVRGDELDKVAERLFDDDEEDDA